MSKICFIVGHGKSKSGGYDSGAISKNQKYHEFKIAREIAKYAQEYYNKNYEEKADLMNYNADLYLDERIKEANKKGYDFIAEIHLNAGGGTGAETYYSKNSSKGKKIAEEISDTIAGTLSIRNRGAKTKIGSQGTDYFGIIRRTKMEAVLIETVFIDTAADLSKVSTAAGQKKCGEAIARAIATARGINKKTTKPVQKPTISTNKETEEGYKVRITAYSLTIRKEPNVFGKIVGYIKHKEVYTIIEEKGNWGKLKSGVGWINLRYTKKV